MKSCIITAGAIVCFSVAAGTSLSLSWVPNLKILVLIITFGSSAPGLISFSQLQGAAKLHVYWQSQQYTLPKTEFKFLL